MLKRKALKKGCSKKKGQSTVEYIILVAAIIAALIIFLAKDGPFYNAYNATLHGGTDGMENMATRLGNSRYDPTTAPPEETTPSTAVTRDTTPD